MAGEIEEPCLAGRLSNVDEEGRAIRFQPAKL
jgi:hypothetical protein